MSPVVSQIRKVEYGKNEISLADNLINIINTARENAFKKVNEELISMYWQVGEYLHREAQKSTFGDSYIDSIANEIQEEFPGIKGFNRRGLYRMKQFYETYAENEVVTPLVTQISWTNHLLIMSGCKSDEEREFYIRLGGDEFVMVIDNPILHEPAKAIASVRERLRACPKENGVEVSSAVGWSTGEGKNVRRVVEVADANMYADKVQGREGRNR